MKGMFDVTINIGDLFGECMDQTLLDYRERTAESGQSITTTHTMEGTLEDIFRTNLRSVAGAVASTISAGVLGCHFGSENVFFRLKHIHGVPLDIAGSLIKDALKYGMLCWWYKSRDVQLYQFYALEYDNALSDIRRKVIGTHTSRPYRFF